MYNTNTHPTGQQITLNLQMIDQNLILSIILSQAFISINLGQTIPKRNKQNNNSNIKNKKNLYYNNNTGLITFFVFGNKLFIYFLIK